MKNMKKFIKLGLMSAMCAGIALTAVGCPNSSESEDFTEMTIAKIIEDAKKITPSSSSSSASSSSETTSTPCFFNSS